MKYALALLLAAFAASAEARLAVRCVDNLGQITTQDHPCAQPPRIIDASLARPGDLGAVKPAAGPSFKPPTEYGPGDWNREQPARRRAQARGETRAIGLRVQALQESSADSRAAEYAENRRACQDALRVAALCGKFAGTFSCDEKGFHKTTADTAAPPRPAVANGYQRAFKMDQCAQAVTRAGA